MKFILKESCEEFLRNDKEKVNIKLLEKESFGKDKKNTVNTNDKMKEIEKKFNDGKNQVKYTYANESYNPKINNEKNNNKKNNNKK